MGKHEIWELQSMQAASLKTKISLTKTRIRQWVDAYGEDGVYVSFSGGKDSTVLLTIAREEFPDIKAVFVDTGLEYPEIREFVKTWDNVEWIKPKLTFKEVVAKYGYPIISKEVSECVYGARKYLTSVINSETIDRPTDRPTDRTGIECGNYSARVGKKSASPLSMGGAETCRKRQVWKAVQYAEQGGGVESEGSQISWGSELLQTLLIQDFTKTIDNFRVQRLMGILPKRGKATMETIPRKPEKSMFSCERYQFFLDAPFEISNRCCEVMKKSPIKKYAKETGRHGMTAMMASESRLRTQQWLNNGCNGFDMKHPISNPMAFWMKQDVLAYIVDNDVKIASVYGDIVRGDDQIDGQMDFRDYGIFDMERPLFETTGAQRTGCMFCLFGIQREKSPNRLEQMKITHPKQYEYLMKPEAEGGLGYKEKIDWINEHGNMSIKY